MSPVWQPFKIQIPAPYIKPNMYRNIGRAIAKRLAPVNTIEEAIKQGWMEEIPPRKNNTARVFAIYLQDNRDYHDIPVIFNLKKDGQLL